MRKAMLVCGLTLLLVLQGCVLVPVPRAMAQEPTQVEVVNPVEVQQPLDVRVITPAPPPPAEVTVSGITDTTANVSWKPSAYASTYTVWVNGERAGGTTGTGLTLTGLVPDTEYNVQVSAANAAGESTTSSSVTFTTLPPVPSTPVGVSIENVGESSATVSWLAAPASEKVTSYIVYVDGQPVADVDTTTVELTNLSPGPHFVSVASVNENREGPRSAPVRIDVGTVPAPTGFVVINKSADAVALRWDPVAGANEYVLLGAANEEILRTTATNCTLRGLSPATSYTLQVAAIRADGNTSLPATLTVSTEPASGEPGLAAYTEVAAKYLSGGLTAIYVLVAVGLAFAVADAAADALGGYRWRWRW